jgi:hypothetical protein
MQRLKHSIESSVLLRAGIGASWWVLYPPFTVLAIRLAFERACGDPYDLMPAIASQPKWGWPLAVVYLLAHVWLLAVYLIWVRQTGCLTPGVGVRRSLWRTTNLKIILMLGTFVIEYLPMAIWRAAGRCCLCG